LSAWHLQTNYRTQIKYFQFEGNMCNPRVDKLSLI